MPRLAVVVAPVLESAFKLELEHARARVLHDCHVRI